MQGYRTTGDVNKNGVTDASDGIKEQLKRKTVQGK